MSSVKIKAKVIVDNSGFINNIYLLFSESGEITLVTEYLVFLKIQEPSLSTINSLLRGISLFLEYLEANKYIFSDPVLLFTNFSTKLYSGTIGANGLDPSGLFWLPKSPKVANRHIYELTKFTNWVSHRYNTTSMNPLSELSSHEERLIYAAWFRKNQNDFLGHIKKNTTNFLNANSALIKPRRLNSSLEFKSVAFPERLWFDFFSKGIGKSKNKFVALRDQLILLLLHGGGLRESEALSLWISDVLIDDENNAIVRIYSETEGFAPFNWKSRSGSKSRQSFLLEKYGRQPRCHMSGTSYLGSKSRLFEHISGYIQVHWFPREYGVIFSELWRLYSKFRAISDSNHPYAFIAFNKKQRGNPYTLNSFHQNYANALKRIGYKKSKIEGLSPHAHRHSYCQRLVSAGVEPLVIRRCMHHRSIDSQLQYMHQTPEEITQALNCATIEINTNKINSNFNWQNLLKHGFDDIDPLNHFSGSYPRFKNL